MATGKTNSMSGSSLSKIRVFSVTVIGTASGKIHVFDQDMQNWVTPTDIPMDIAIGKNLLMKTDVQLTGAAVVQQSGEVIVFNAPCDLINLFGWYFTQEFGGDSIEIYATEG